MHRFLFCLFLVFPLVMTQGFLRAPSQSSLVFSAGFAERKVQDTFLRMEIKEGKGMTGKDHLTHISYLGLPGTHSNRKEENCFSRPAKDQATPSATPSIPAIWLSVSVSGHSLLRSDLTPQKEVAVFPQPHTLFLH